MEIHIVILRNHFTIILQYSYYVDNVLLFVMRRIVNLHAHGNTACILYSIYTGCRRATVLSRGVVVAFPSNTCA